MMKLPIELLAELEKANSDVQACKLLADNGIDPEQFEQTLPDSFLELISSGYAGTSDFKIYCPICGNANTDDLSRQSWASMFTDNAVKYRCRKCSGFFRVTMHGSVFRVY